MTPDSPRILELRRRVQADPASIAFAQLAEEYRRAGANDEAVAVCRAGLATHPGYLSARVILGRALIELGRLDEAKLELDLVAATAPDNLPAIRGLAEIHQQRGEMSEALTFYKRALALASFDPDLREAVARISTVLAPPVPVTPAAPSAPVGELFDFDTLLAQLGETLPEAPAPPMLANEGATSDGGLVSPKLASDGQVIDGGHPFVPITIEVPLDDTDAFADMERALRGMDEQRTRDEQAAGPQVMHRREQSVLNELEAWLADIMADRSNQSRA